MGKQGVSSKRGWTVVMAGTGINLALGILYTWSIFKGAIADSIAGGGAGAFAWDKASINDPYATACLMFALAMIVAGKVQDKFGPRITCMIGGLMVGPFLSPYIVSKHAVVALSEATFHELATLETKVRISVLCPGAVATGIADSARIRPSDLSDAAPLRSDAERSFDEMVRAGVGAGMAPDDVGRIVFEGLRAERFWIYTHPVHEASIRARFDGASTGSATRWCAATSACPCAPAAACWA